jgi:tRNA (guanosine-2'-O-)-methyltransferase
LEQISAPIFHITKSFTGMTPERLSKLTRVANHRQPDISLILENVFDPHNISAVLRTCDSVGIQEVYVLNTRIPRHEKWGRRSSSSSAKWLTVHQYDDFDACIQTVRARYGQIFTTHLASDAVDLYRMDFTRSMALVFGNEHSGCSEEIIARADGNFLIPQVGIIQSLNISVACAITLYEAFRQRRQAGYYDTPRMNAEAHAALLQSWGAYPAAGSDVAQKSGQ